MRGGVLRTGEEGDEKDDDNGCFVEDFFGGLPEGFVANALSKTSPPDACRLSLVGSVFRSAAEWDAVWESFLPPDYQKIIAEAVDGGGASLMFGSKKELYLRLCDHPLIIDSGKKSFSLDKWTGKKCYMLAARALTIVWGDTPRYWRWNSEPNSRFNEVAELLSVCWLEVCGEICTSMLSPNTTYVAYLVFKLTSEAYGFEYQPAEVSIEINGQESQTQTVFLDPEAGQRQSHLVVPRRYLGMVHRGGRHLQSPSVPIPSKGNCPKQRQDGWLEVELGDYFNKEGEEGELQMTMKEVKGGNWKGGLIIQGIDIRPKGGK